MSLRSKLDNLPNEPGVYHMLGEGGRLLYIGKAKNLRKRVRSYFGPTQERAFTRQLVEEIVDVDFIATPSEKEALLLECDQIKRFSPHYNLQFKDQKTYPYLCFTTKEPFPRLFKTRSKKHKGVYFGPFTDIQYLNRLVRVVHELFPLKKCNQKTFPKGFKPCAYFHMGKCLDYCTGNVPRSMVDGLVAGVSQVLKGETGELVAKLEERMKKEILRLQFEKASILKGRIDMLRSVNLKPTVMRSTSENADVFHYALNENVLAISVLRVRSGELAGKRTFDFENRGAATEDDESMVDVFAQFALEYYRTNPNDVVDELFSPFDADGLEALRETLEELFRKREPDFKSIGIKKPVRGRYKRFLGLAELNAQQSFHQVERQREQQKIPHRLKALLGLPRLPRTIESFDIANTYYAHITAGMVRFRGLRPDKANYRTFLIRSVDGPNDVASMEEAVFRRYSRLVREGRSLPDLVLVDGGRAQLAAALRSFLRLGMKTFPVVAMAKRHETLYSSLLPGPVNLKLDDGALRFLMRVRNETHRFANMSHVRRRDREELRSRLLQLKGIGEKKARKILRRFASMEAMTTAEEKTLREFGGLSEKDMDSLKNLINSTINHGT